MNFLHIPKQGRYRYLEGNPFDYINSINMKVVNNYFSMYVEYSYIFNEYLPILSLYKEDGFTYGLIIFNKDGNVQLDDDKATMNNLATKLLNAYRSIYIGNYDSIYSDAILVKTRDIKSLVEITKKDKFDIRRKIKDAEWIQQYMGRTE